VRSQLLTKLGPRIKVVLDSNRSTNALALPNRPELLERSGTIDRWLVGSGSLEDIVCAAVARDGALLLSSRRRVVRAICLHNVVLDQGVASPAIERNVGVLIGSVPSSRVGDDALTAGVPAFACDEVADVGPFDVVLKYGLARTLERTMKNKTYASARVVVVCHTALAIGPVRVEESVACTGTGGNGSRDQGGGLIALFGVENEVEWRRKRCGSAAESKQDGRERDHVDWYDGGAWWPSLSSMPESYIPPTIVPAYYRDSSPGQLIGERPRIFPV
jgi:hypothetical protein